MSPSPQRSKHTFTSTKPGSLRHKKWSQSYVSKRNTKGNLRCLTSQMGGTELPCPVLCASWQEVAGAWLCYWSVPLDEEKGRPFFPESSQL